MENRDKTNDQVTVDCAKAIQKFGAGVKLQLLLQMKHGLRNLI